MKIKTLQEDLKHRIEDKEVRQDEEVEDRGDLVCQWLAVYLLESDQEALVEVEAYLEFLRQLEALLLQGLPPKLKISQINRQFLNKIKLPIKTQ